jgi:hypothetical protein
MLHNIVAVEGELKRLDITQSTLCVLTEISAGSLSDILRGVKKVTFAQEQAIYKAIEGIDRLAQACAPLQIDLRKTLQLREQIELLDAGRLQISIVVQEEAVKDEPVYSLKLRNGNYFLRVNRGIALPSPEVLSTFNLLGSSVFIADAAKRGIAALRELGYADVKSIENKFANPDNIIFDVAIVGL